MVNLIWLFMLLAGVAAGIVTGRADEVTAAVFSASSEAVKITIEIIGILGLWLGLLKLAEASGLVKSLARLTAPLARWLFPDIPKDHPAFSSIVMNLGANLLGLGNAATPFGLKAMEQLQSLNPQKDTATFSMITFLALNTACITLIPATVLALRVQAGSRSPTETVIATIFASCCGCVFAVFLDRFCRRKFSGKI
ncbi:MAG: spore maturation protein [Clostridiales bacterium]|nr:spore maturation protein [Clostridiales bacterium]